MVSPALTHKKRKRAVESLLNLILRDRNTPSSPPTQRSSSWLHYLLSLPTHRWTGVSIKSRCQY